MVEPSGFRTDWAGSSMERAEPLEAYQEIDQIAERRAFQREDNNGSQPGNPDLAARALLETLDRDRRSVSCSATSRTTSPSTATKTG
jgi:hypothetical protein